MLPLKSAFGVLGDIGKNLVTPLTFTFLNESVIYANLSGSIATSLHKISKSLPEYPSVF